MLHFFTPSSFWPANNGGVSWLNRQRSEVACLLTGVTPDDERYSGKEAVDLPRPEAACEADARRHGYTPENREVLLPHTFGR